jgi:drug/metabolite transporter (DMT)-like permease
LEIVRRLPAVTASLGARGIPVFGVISTVLITGEKLSIADVVGSALIFAASASVLFARSTPAPGSGAREY